MIDPLTTLAISMRAKKGAYALLLGSGISRSAQIPTGWDLVLDLIRRVARLENVDCGEDPAAWFRQTYQEEPDYGILLGRIAQTSAERSQIVRDFIEPSSEERDLGLKLPTEAHRAIAELIGDGYIRVVVTTNFDRLLESALGDIGVVAAVIDSADAVKGTLPLAHNSCTIIKLHGDYVDARIKNTSEELAAYPGPINRLLDQAFREYGLVVCGWSGEWDTALASALKRRRSPWFATYWVSYREPRSAAQNLIKQRNAKVVTNMDGDDFFRHLADSVASLEELDRPELVSAAMARAAVKRYIDDPSRRIRLHDLVIGEANRVRRRIEEEPREDYIRPLTEEEITKRLSHYEHVTEVLRTLMATGCFWGENSHEGHWIAALERIADPSSIQGRHYEDWANLRRYPALLTLYTGGLAAVARGRYETLARLLYSTTVRIDETGDRFPLVLKVHPPLLSQAAASILAPNVIPAVALLLHMEKNQLLWTTLQEYLPDKNRFRDSFDRFEYLFGLSHTDLSAEQGWRPWGPLGVFAFREHGFGAKRLIDSINAEIDAEGPNWSPLKAGLFRGSQTRLREAKSVFDPIVLDARYR